MLTLSGVFSIRRVNLVQTLARQGRLLYPFMMPRHERREVVHFDVTSHPTAAWLAQQLAAPMRRDALGR